MEEKIRNTNSYKLVKFKSLKVKFLINQGVKINRPLFGELKNYNICQQDSRWNHLIDCAYESIKENNPNDGRIRLHEDKKIAKMKISRLINEPHLLDKIKKNYQNN